MEKVFKRICNVYSYILIFLVFMGQTFLKFKINNINFNVARCCMLVVFFLLLIGFIINRKKLSIKNKNMKYILIFYFIWGLFSIISFFWSIDIKMYLITNFFIITGIANIFFFTYFVDIKNNAKNYFFIMQVALFVNCLYYIKIKDTTIGGFYHNTNDLATAITFIFPITIYMLLNSKRVMGIIYNVLFFCVYYYSYTLIFSRANVLGIYTGFLFMLFLIFIKNRKVVLNSFKLKSIISSLAIITILLMLNMTNTNLGTVVSKPIESREEDLIAEIKKDNSKKTTDKSKLDDNNELDEEEKDIIRSKHLYTSNEIRINLIYNTIDFLKKDYKLFTGVGTGNTIYYMENYAKFSTNYEYSVHNYWLEILLSNGILIFIGYIIAYTFMIKNLVKHIDLKEKFEKIFKEEKVFYLFFLSAFIIASISSSNMLTREWIWIAFALIISYIKNLSEQKNEE